MFWRAAAASVASSAASGAARSRRALLGSASSTSVPTSGVNVRLRISFDVPNQNATRHSRSDDLPMFASSNRTPLFNLRLGMANRKVLFSGYFAPAVSTRVTSGFGVGEATPARAAARSVGTRVSVRVDLGGGGYIKKKK